MIHAVLLAGFSVVGGTSECSLPPSAPVDLVRRLADRGRACAPAFLRYLESYRLRGPRYERARGIFQRAGVPAPPYSGWFNVPKLKPGQQPPFRRVDSLSLLLGVRVSRQDEPLRAELAGVLARIRGIGESHDPDVVAPLVTFTFRPDGYLFRTEVSRAIETLGSAAIPGLLDLASWPRVRYDQDRFRYLVRKYARYMLTVIEEGDPLVALSRADRKLKLRLLAAYGRHHVADALRAIILATAEQDGAVRQAAARALEAFFEGPAPRVRRRRLKLPGGRETEERRILYMSYRQRAYYELRKELDQLIPGRYDRYAKGRELVARLLEARKQARRDAVREKLERALSSLEAGEWEAGLQELEAILAASGGQLPDPGRMADALWDAAVRLASSGRLGPAARLRLMAGVLTGEMGKALADWEYLLALEALAGGRSAASRAWVCLGLAPDQEGCRRLLLAGLGDGPAPGQVAAGLVLLLGLGLAVWIGHRIWRLWAGTRP